MCVSVSRLQEHVCTCMYVCMYVLETRRLIQVLVPFTVLVESEDLVQLRSPLVCTYVMYVCTYVPMYICMYVCKDVTPLLGYMLLVAQLLSGCDTNIQI